MSIQIVTLIVVCGFLTMIGTVLAKLILGQGTWSEAVWWTWLRITSTNYLGQDSGTIPRMVSTLVILAGWLIFGLLISLLSTAVQSRLVLLKRGITHVLCTNHAVVMGWGSTIYSVLDELFAGDEPVSRNVVVLSDRDKEDMEEDIGRYCLNRRSRRTICRTGSIDVLADVQRVNVATAREVIILGDEARGESSDGQVFKAVLACAQALAEERANSISGTPGPTMVAAIGSERTRRVLAPLVASQPDATVLLLEPRKTLSRILAQCSACPTLAGVYRDLLSYGSGVAGSSSLSAEIYIVPVRRCRVPVGTTFDECLLSFPKAMPVGFFSDGKMVLNPYSTSSRAEHRLRADDSLIVVADSFQDVKWEPVETEPREFKARALPKPARSILLMGSGLKAQMTLDSLPHYLPAGSRIVCPDEVRVPNGGACAIEHIPLDTPGDIDDALRELFPGVDTVVLVDDEDDRERHDGRMLYLLGTVHVRSLEAGHRQPDIVVELLDPRNRDIARAVGARETIVSSEIVSNYMVQLARQPIRAAVFADLLDPESSEVYVKPWDVYGLADEELSFEEIVLRARSLGQVAIGYARGGTPILSPADRRRKARLASYEEIVVIAED